MFETHIEGKKELSLEDEMQELREDFLHAFSSSDFSDVSCSASYSHFEEVEKLDIPIRKCSALLERDRLLSILRLVVDSCEKNIIIPNSEPTENERLRYFGEDSLSEDVGHGLGYISFQEGYGQYSSLKTLFTKIRDRENGYKWNFSPDELVSFCKMSLDELEKIGSMPDGTLEYYRLCDEMGISRELAVKERIIRHLKQKIEETFSPRYNQEEGAELRNEIQETSVMQDEHQNNSIPLKDFLSLAKEIDILLDKFFEKQDGDLVLSGKDRRYLIDYDLQQSLYREDILNSIEGGGSA